MQDTRRCQFNAAKAVLRYLKGTKDCGILYSRTGKLYGYTDADYAGVTDMTANLQAVMRSSTQVVPYRGAAKSRQWFPNLDVNRSIWP